MQLIRSASRIRLLLILFAVVPILGGEEECTNALADKSGDDSCEAKNDDVTIDIDKTTASNNNNKGEEDVAPVAEEEIERPIWWNYSIDDLFEEHFNCGDIIYGYEDEDDEFEDDDDIDSESYTENPDVVGEEQLQKIRDQFKLMRDLYIKEVNLVPIEEGKTQLVVPVRIGDAGPSKGRGVFATEPIPKDTLVLDLLNGSTGIFKTAESYRKFTVSLSEEAGCNFLEWTWVQNIPPIDEEDDDIRIGLTIYIGFDEGNLMNASDWGDGIPANVRCGSPPKSDEGGDGNQAAERGPCRFHYYAARDIAAGKSAFVLFYVLNSCIQYRVSAVWPLHFDLGLPLFDCLCKPNALTYVIITSLSLHKQWQHASSRRRVTHKLCRV